MFALLLSSSLYSQTASLKSTLSLKVINGIQTPYQNDFPLPSFEKQKRNIIDLAGVWKKMRFAANHSITLAKRDENGYADLINENPTLQQLDEEELGLIKSKIQLIIDQASTTYPFDLKAILKKKSF